MPVCRVAPVVGFSFRRRAHYHTELLLLLCTRGLVPCCAPRPPPVFVKSAESKRAERKKTIGVGPFPTDALMPRLIIYGRRQTRQEKEGRAGSTLPFFFLFVPRSVFTQDTLLLRWSFLPCSPPPPPLLYSPCSTTPQVLPRSQAST